MWGNFCNSYAVYFEHGGTQMKTLKGKSSHWPTKPLCPVCKRRKVFETHSFVSLSASTLIEVCPRKKTVEVDDLKVETSLGILYHGAHDSGIGGQRDIFVRSDIADRVDDQEVEFYFCSTSCLKKFLCDWVDDLETKIETECQKCKK